MTQSDEDRRRGALYGLAVGDALGAPVEFQSPGTFEPVTDYRDGGPHKLAAGEWTDDTSMALALADSLAEGAFDLDDQARRYLAWYRTGEYSSNGMVFDIGITTANALHRYEKRGDARSCGDEHEMSSGNGSIMRLAPVAIRYAEALRQDHAVLVRHAVDSSRPTHGSPACLSACAYLATVLAGLIVGMPREAVLATDGELLQGLRTHHDLDPAVERIAAGSFREKQPPAIRGSGYVVDCLEAALWAFHEAPDFSTAVLAAVNLGDDADTTGAVCGQLAGACFGLSGIPAAWRERLARRDLIDGILDRLLASPASG